jgi:endonuclease/exonuclease/phosphatase family metal-dependent hydrolase
MKLVKTKIKSGIKQKRNGFRNRNRTRTRTRTRTQIQKRSMKSKSKSSRKTKKIVQYEGVSPEKLKKKFMRLVQSEQYKVKLPAKAVGAVLRLATFNVHYFTDVYEKRNTYYEVLDVIMSINADVIILQEILVGGSHVVINKDLTLDISNLFYMFQGMGYMKVIHCATVPSWFNSSYGNIMLVKDNICPMILCDIDESTYTFAKSNSATVVSGQHEGIKETRCYIYIKIELGGIVYHIIGTHLDISSESTRLNQIQHIVQTYDSVRGPNDIIIIMGDFNTFDTNQYRNRQYSYLNTNEFTKMNGLVYEYLVENGYNDLTTNPPQLVTTWNLTRVDFIFSSHQLRAECYTMYTAASDHFPVIADIFHPSRYDSL